MLRGHKPLTQNELCENKSLASSPGLVLTSTNLFLKRFPINLFQEASSLPELQSPDEFLGAFILPDRVKHFQISWLAR